MDNRKLLCRSIYVRLCAPIDLYAPEKSRTRGLLHVKLTPVFFPCAVPIIIVIIYSPQFFEMRNKHIYTQATRAINMKYCLIEDIVLKTLPRAFFHVFLLFVIYLLFSIPPVFGLFNRLHFEPSNPPRDEEEEEKK
jgi:hypothetical protein